MRRIVSSYLSLLAFSLALVLGAGCAEEPSAEPPSPLDGGLGGQEPLCPNCGPDAGPGPGVSSGLTTAASPATATAAAPAAGGTTAGAGQVAPAFSPEQCKMLAPGACAANSACSPIVGLAYDSVRYCRGEAQLPVACQARGVECGFGKVRVVDPLGQRWLLPNQCIPEGFTPAPSEVHPITWIEDYTACPSAGVQTRCAQLDEAGCATNETCFAQRGTQLNERRTCKQGAQRFVACVQNSACNRVLTYARDSSGNTWELIGSCLPSGYSALPQSSVSAHTNWSTCL